MRSISRLLITTAAFCAFSVPAIANPIADPVVVTDPVTLAPDNGWSVIGTLDIASGRVFQEQAILKTTHPVAIIDIVATHGDWGGEPWRATGRPEDGEKDWYGWRDFHFGEEKLQLNVAMFDLPHTKAIWRFRAALSYPVGDHCTGTLYGDLLRGGFTSEVIKTDAACTFPIIEGLAFTPIVQLSHDTHYDVTAVGFNLGVTKDVELFDRHFWVRPYFKGYRAIIGHGPANDDTGTLFAVQAGAHF